MSGCLYCTDIHMHEPLFFFLTVFLALCLAGWAVSGASFEAQKTSPVCYLCNDTQCQNIESVYDHLTDNLTLWSRGEMASLPQCPTTPPPSGKCLLCVESQKVYAVCDSEIIKPVFEGQGSSMPVIEANCPSTVSTDETGGPGGFAGSPDPNPPTMTPDVTGRLSKEKIIAIVLIPIAFFVILILVVLRRRTSSSVVWCPLQKSTQSNTRPS
ncbi:uncharacterized protein LOC115152306 isoform X2 [Salmo trutta]|uniref:uncharacterized protein LOC115152306 isoform X2 n=1 Tax=Salmo trutta TaxID=8032 RepID=UPI001131C442|nr:uncharacterized protein LOC115152306 isoform X2 [Salmo trutta]